VPVDSTHPEYDKRAPQWRVMRDVIGGQDRIHESGTQYLPKLGGQTDKEYKAYRNRADFIGATSRTLDAMTGLMFRKPVQTDVPPALEPWLEDLDLAGTDMQGLMEGLAEELITTARVGILVDYPRREAEVLPAAQAERMNIRPYLTVYSAENIINWRIERVDNAQKPVMVALHETEELIKDGFERESVDQIRVLALEEEGYIQRIYRYDDQIKDWIQVDEIIPLINGQRMNFIPFLVYGPSGQGFKTCKPILKDLADLNLSHYRSNADLEHGAHFTGLPTPVVTGHALEDGQSLEIGSGTAWVFPDSGANAFYLEFSGKGLDALEKRVEKKEFQMAAMGARLLAPEKRMAEAAETEVIRRAGENSVLASIAVALSGMMTDALNLMARWAGAPEEASTQVNRDFIPTRMSAQELTAWTQAVQAGQISQQTYFEGLKAGEMVRDDLEFEEEQERIADQPPALSSFGGVNAFGNQ